MKRALHEQYLQSNARQAISFFLMVQIRSCPTMYGFLSEGTVFDRYVMWGCILDG
ncbi:MAG TPA: hypothetical protein PKD12_14030 [Nitrospira sp.]|nr:hypothetical protein [Nitrospira sp.]